MRLRRVTIAATLMLVASMATSAWASCMADMNLAEQMACCENGPTTCPMHDSAADCCTVEGRTHQQVNIATHEPSSPAVNPPTVVTTPAAAALAPAFVRLSQSTLHRIVLKGPDPPPYLLGSAFLV